MKYLFFTLITLFFACTNDNIPSICDELGYDPNPEKFENGYFANYLWNGKYRNMDYGGFSIHDTINGFGFGKINSCGLWYYSGGFAGYQFISQKKQKIDKAKLLFNYGGLNEVVTTQEYDSLVVSPDFENFMIIDFISADTSIIEGRFQMHLKKRWCTYWDKGTLQGCMEPYYEVGEPKDIIITEAKFRLKSDK
jgi:hypothetical protein